MNYVSLDHVGSFDKLHIVVRGKTGVLYSAQCGGIGCSHPEIEGFYLTAIDIPEDMIDDCEFGCLDISMYDDLKMKLAKEIDKYVKKNKLNFITGFDFDNIKDLEEGIWPVIVNCEDEVFGTNIVNAKAVLFVGNCD